MAWNRSAPKIDNLSTTAKKHYMWFWCAFGFVAVATIALVLSFHRKMDGIFATSDVKWVYQVADGGIVLGGKNETAVTNAASGELIIPEIIDGKPVRRIGDRAFYGCQRLTGVTIPSSVTHIGEDAFSACSGLKSFSVEASNPLYSSRNGMLCSKDGRTLLVGVNGDVTIPLGVTNIEGGAFSGRCGLTSVTIPSSVTSIGHGAFSYCSELTSVTIFDGVTSLGRWAFGGCSNLVSMTIPSSVTNIEWAAFYDCVGLTSMIIPSSVTCIGGLAFWGCRGLTNVTISSSVTSIGEHAFSCCGGLASVIIPSSVSSIGDNAFSECRKLNSVTMHEGVTNIGSSAFSDCGNLTSVLIPSSVTSIGDCAFSDCSRLRSVTIPPSVTNVGRHVFLGCRELKSVKIPSILKARFGDLSESQKVYIPTMCTSKTNGVEWTYEVVGDGVFLGSSDKGTHSVRPDKKAKLAVPQNSSGTLIIPETLAGRLVSGIGAGAFSGCNNLMLVTIPSSVTTIGSDAFRNCMGLTSMTIPSSVTSVGDRAFEGCRGLTSVAIPSCKTHIGREVFSGCDSIKNVVVPGLVGDIDFSQVTNLVVSDGTTHITPGRGLVRKTFRDLVSVSIPASVKRIGSGAFSHCRDLMSFSVDASNPSYSSRNGMLCSKDGRTLLVGVNGDVTIPSSVTNISSLSFFGCRGLKSFSVDKSNPSYSSRNGMLCTRDGKTLIVGVNGDVTIPSGVTSIGFRAFSFCGGLTSVTIPESVTNINWAAFFWGAGEDRGRMVKSFSVDASNPSYSSRNGMLCSKDGKNLISGVNGVVTIPEGVTNICSEAFCDCAGLISVTIPSSVTSIGYGAFKGCGGLTNVVIPSSVTSIGNWAFEGCSGLTMVTIPSSVTNIGSFAFSDCIGLESVTIPSSVADRLGAFSRCRNLKSVGIMKDGNVDVISSDELLAWKSEAERAEIELRHRGRSKTSRAQRTMATGGATTSQNVDNSTKDVNRKAKVHGYYTWTYSVKNGEATIEATGGKERCAVAPKPEGSVYIPSKLEGVPVTGIGRSAFSGCSGLTGVTIPSSVTSIGTMAFSDCSGLRSVAIPSSVTNIGYQAFDGTPFYNNQPDGMVILGGLLYKYKGRCPSSVNIPEGVGSVGDSAFSRCRELAVVTIPASVTNIGRYAFSGCGGRKSFVVDPANPKYSSDNGLLCSMRERTLVLGVNGDVTIPPGVTSIGPGAFDGCRGLTSISIPSSVTNIGDNAFSDCNGLMSVTIPRGVTSIGNSAFKGCSGLTSVVIPLSVTSIGQGVFDGCRGLTLISIPPSVMSIGNKAFSGCGGLTSVAIPSSVTNIGLSAFFSCSNLTEVTMPASLENIGHGMFSGCCRLAGVAIPSSVTNIGSRAFSGCSGLTGVTIPSNVTSIGSGAFEGCSGLASVSFPPSVTSLGQAVFEGCSRLTSVTIPSGVTSIGASTFERCAELKSVTIPPSVTNIGRSAFKGCRNLTSIIIPLGVTSVGDWAFEGCSGLTSVMIPSGVTNIGSSAFYGCSGLTSVRIPSSVAVIGYRAFDGTPFYNNQPDGMVILGGGLLYKYKGRCPSSVKISEEVMSIGNSAFSGCCGLTSVTMTSNVTSIGVGAFRGCSGLTSVTIPEGVMSIENGAFSDCVGLTAVTIPASITNIADFAFSGCTELALVKVQSHVANIGRNAFRDCCGLTTVMIPSSLTNIVTTVTMPNSTMSVRGHGRFKSRTVSMKLDDAVKAVFGRAGTFLPPTNGMTTVVFEKSTAVKRNAGVRDGRPFGGGSLRTRRQQRHQ